MDSLALRNAAKAIMLTVRHSPALMAAVAVSGIVLSPFIAVSMAILMVGVLCCIPVILTVSTVGCVVWLGPRAGELARLWGAEALRLVSCARATPLGMSLERGLKNNPVLAAGAVCCMPILIPIGLLAGATICMLLVVSLPLLVPGACIILANADFRRSACGMTQRTVERVLEQLGAESRAPALRATPRLPTLASAGQPACADAGAHAPARAPTPCAHALALSARAPAAALIATRAEEAEASASRSIQHEVADAPADTLRTPPAPCDVASAPSSSPAQSPRARPSGRPSARSPFSARSEMSSTSSTAVGDASPRERGGGGRKRGGKAARAKSAGGPAPHSRQQ
ncbi:hypothetical protein KFE25_006164 [Diacronema lutheri]|uniref:Uncharacterized protein n=1 Tax=Diacronema lutheri TaxID=2081491 RepID=A0A8J5XSJ0_DIALT|nr:hypothetical protein KFE25_006164 [Diacronema lutheri]